MLTNIRATNRGGNGDSVEFDNTELRITKGLDLSGTTATVNYSESNIDGSIYQNTRLNNAEFDIEFNIMKKLFDENIMDSKRARMYRVFNPKENPIRIDFKDSSGMDYYITAELIATPIMSPDKSNYNASMQKGLLQFIATDPFIYASDETFTDVSTWIPNFEFILEIPEEGIEMGYREPSLIKNIFNHGNESVGMEIEFVATSRVVNPSLTNVNTYEKLKLNVEMLSGDRIVVNTQRRKRKITLIRNNEEFNYFNKFDYLGSKFIQLKPGDNLFRRDADEGLDYLDIRINYRNKYVGV